MSPATTGFEILVADDDVAVRDLLADFLREQGLQVATASDGRAAVAALMRSNGRFRMVLTDVSMPGADGFAVLRAAQAANPSAYVVILTGFASMDSAVAAVRLGARDYITKPFSLGQIDVILQQAMSRFALEDENRRLAADDSSRHLQSIDARLEAIERRLLKLESLLTRRARLDSA